MENEIKELKEEIRALRKEIEDLKAQPKTEYHYYYYQYLPNSLPYVLPKWIYSQQITLGVTTL